MLVMVRAGFQLAFFQAAEPLGRNIRDLWPCLIPPGGGYAKDMRPTHIGDGRLEGGFLGRDPWPRVVAERGRAAVRRSPLYLAAAIVAIGVLLLGTIELFAIGFGPCLHAAC